MEETITVGELMKELSLFEPKEKVMLYAVGFTSKDSYSIPLTLEGETVSMHEGVVNIHFSNM